MSESNTFTKIINLPSRYLGEAPLLFRNNLIDIDPKRGLSLLGPVDATQEDLQTIRVGIVSDSEGIQNVTDIFKHLNENSVHNTGENPFTTLRFPSFEKAFHSKMLFHRNFNATLLSQETSSILDIENPNLRIKKASELYAKKVINICEKVTRPEVIICHKPSEIEATCGGISFFDRRTKGLSPQERKSAAEIRKNVETHKILAPLDEDTKDFINMVIKANFRRHLKSLIMEKGVPIQIITQSTLESLNSNIGIPNIPQKRKKNQDPSTIAWNLSVALYYKSNHFPWRVGNLSKGACYVGISFFYDETTYEKNMFASLAQIFSDTGEGMIVRGDSFYWDTKEKGSPHLTKEAAENLLSNAVDLYKQHHDNQAPNRIVIHKSSRYQSLERKGFGLGLQDVPRYDFLSLTRGREAFFYRNGEKAVLRGTYLTLPDQSALLYTKGYVPYLKCYNGPRVPKPIEISERYGDTPMELLLREIMALTRLDWNTTRYSSYNPITLKLSYRVGKILGVIPEGRPIQNQYSFYM